MLYNPHTNPMRVIPISQVRKLKLDDVYIMSKITHVASGRLQSEYKAHAFNHCTLWHPSHVKYVSFCAVLFCKMHALSSPVQETKHLRSSLKVGSEDFRINFF